MSTAETIDRAVDDAYEAADIGFMSASGIFPLCEVTDNTMGLAQGHPGALGEAAIKWRSAAGELQAAQQALTQTCGELGAYDWSGSDRDAFNNDVEQLAAQLGDNHNYAMAVGAALEMLTVPFGLLPPACMAMGVAMGVIAAATEVAAASVVGDVTGVAEELYATGWEMAVTFNEIIDAMVTAAIALCGAAALIMEISDAADIAALEDNGDADAGKDFGKAVVDSLGDVAKNLEGFAASAAADKLADKATDGLPTGDVASRAEKAFIKDEVAGQAENDNAGAVDLVTGESPSKTIADTLGVSEDVFEPDTEEPPIPANLNELINDGIHFGGR